MVVVLRCDAMEKKDHKKLALVKVVVGLAFAAAAIASFFLPPSATAPLRSAGAAVFAAWDEAFGVSGGGEVLTLEATGTMEMPESVAPAARSVVMPPAAREVVVQEIGEPENVSTSTVSIAASSTSVISASEPVLEPIPESIPGPMPEPDPTPVFKEAPLVVEEVQEAATSSVVLEATTTTSAAASTAASTAADPASTVATTSCGCAAPPSAPALASIGHLLISAVQIAGEASSNDLLKIYNPTTSTIALEHWRLRKRSKSGNEYSLRVLSEKDSLVPGGYFIWANGVNGFGDSIWANVTSSEMLAADNSVAIIDPEGKAIDMVAWGEGQNQFVEGAAYPENPEAGKMLRRKVDAGHYVDTDRNADDFRI